LLNRRWDRGLFSDDEGIEFGWAIRLPASFAIAIHFGQQCHVTARDAPIVFATSFRHHDEVSER
jgi:hypothetical protein